MKDKPTAELIREARQWCQAESKDDPANALIQALADRLELSEARFAEAERVIDDLCSGADILADGPDDSAEAKGEELVAQAVSAADAYRDKYPKEGE